MTSHLAPGYILNLLHQLGSITSMLRPADGIVDRKSSFEFRQFIYQVFTFLLFQLDQRGIQYEELKPQLYSQLEFLTWNIHKLYGTTYTRSFLEPPIDE